MLHRPRAQAYDYFPVGTLILFLFLLSAMGTCRRARWPGLHAHRGQGCAAHASCKGVSSRERLRRSLLTAPPASSDFYMEKLPHSGEQSMQLRCQVRKSRRIDDSAGGMQACCLRSSGSIDASEPVVLPSMLLSQISKFPSEPAQLSAGQHAADPPDVRCRLRPDLWLPWVNGLVSTSETSYIHGRTCRWGG